MQSIKKLYRSNYVGEDVHRDLVWENGQWNFAGEFVPNNIINNQISNRAVVLGNGPSRTMLYPHSDILPMLKRHKGGLLAEGAVQTYGCNAIYRDFDPDFLIVTGGEIAQDIVKIGYWFNRIVYSTHDAVLHYPGKFYLIPQNPLWDAGATAAYIACFDGHKKVYLIGFDGHPFSTTINDANIYVNTRGYSKSDEPHTGDFFVRSMLNVMSVYDDVEFIRVMPTKNWYTPKSWLYLTNFRQIDFREFVIEVDL